ncbi:MAG: hypothetical protein II008_21885 [Oscillospiraceae bacterium]|nr:hypothetical protein [Oscillospiraceae bacterium]
MTYFIYGVLGMLFTVALFAGGVAVGWHLRIRYTARTADAVKTELSEQEKRRQKEDAQAFSQLANYSPELAYGIVRAGDIYETDNEG